MSPRKSITPESRKGYSGKKIPNFCRNVLSKRTELGLKQSELADICGTTKQRISEIEAGHLPNSEDRIIALARALHTDLNTLFGFETEGE